MDYFERHYELRGKYRLAVLNIVLYLGSIILFILFFVYSIEEHQLMSRYDNCDPLYVFFLNNIPEYLLPSVVFFGIAQTVRYFRKKKEKKSKNKSLLQ